MSIARRVKEYLEQNRVPYSHCTHRLAYTAQEVAAAQHVPGREMAKTIILKTDSLFAMAVLPAVMKINMKALRDELPFAHVELATEKEFAALFPDSELGAMAPFGNLYELPVYVDKSLAEDEEIVFNAGTHVDTIRIRYRDFARLVQPKIIDAAIRLEMAANQ
ncbi:MAG: YbaK/EbsC family protein [Acidobacteria bacterium]|nr:YbaK/EbsC family protein [Acidobacteriota bacterium]MCI0723472.1 YbaK/EbsC family protein [Acidobacteriota bacterium]